MVKVTTSNNKEYEMDFAWMTMDKTNCILQWHDNRKLTEIIPEFLDLKWIKMFDPIFNQELMNESALTLYQASTKNGQVMLKFE